MRAHKLAGTPTTHLAAAQPKPNQSWLQAQAAVGHTHTHYGI